MTAPVPHTPSFTRIIVTGANERPMPLVASPSVDLDYALRRAEEEAIATVRLGETAAAERHAEMAALYSARALDLLDDREEPGANQG